MIIWLKRIGFVAAIIIILEVLALASITLLGEDALQRLKDVYLPKKAGPVIEAPKNDDGLVEKCSTFDGKLFCIKEKE